MIFRVLHRDHRAIRRQQRRPFRVQVMIGDHVMLDAKMRQPIDHITIGTDPPGARPARRRVHQADLPRPRIQHRPPHRGDRHARPVRMIIIGGKAKHRIHVRRLRQRPPGRRPLGDLLAAPRPHVAAIHLIAEGRHQHRHPRRSRHRPHKKRNPVLALRVADMGTIKPTRPILRHIERKTLLPPQIALIVVMKMDRAILLRRRLPIMHRAGPVTPRHGPRRQIHQRGMGRMRPNILRHQPINADREIPPRHQPRPQPPSRATCRCKRLLHRSRSPQTSAAPTSH